MDNASLAALGGEEAGMIQMKDVSFAYGEKQILEQFNLTLRKGERICIMAPSGRGKTTILKLLTGHLQPDAGEINGLENSRISMVFQEDRLCETYTVGENIMLGCMRGMLPDGFFMKGNGRKNRHRQIAAHLTKAGLENIIDMPVSSLSGGMKRRVSIVRAILSDSDIVIMDEPFAGIDKENMEGVVRYINEYLMERTFILVSHDEREVKGLSAKIVRL